MFINIPVKVCAVDKTLGTRILITAKFIVFVYDQKKASDSDALAFFHIEIICFS